MSRLPVRPTAFTKSLNQLATLRLTLLPQPPIPTWTRSYTAAMEPRFSRGTDEAATAAALKPLLESPGGLWTLASEGQALERSFKFKTFAKTWVSERAREKGLHAQPPGLSGLKLTDTPQDFMTAVSLQCKLKNHHPEWSNVCACVMCLGFSGLTFNISGVQHHLYPLDDT